MSGCVRPRLSYVKARGELRETVRRRTARVSPWARRAGSRPEPRARAPVRRPGITPTAGLKKSPRPLIDRGSPCAAPAGRHGARLWKARVRTRSRNGSRRSRCVASGRRRPSSYRMLWRSKRRRFSGLASHGGDSHGVEDLERRRARPLPLAGSRRSSRRAWRLAATTGMRRARCSALPGAPSMPTAASSRFA